MKEVVLFNWPEIDRMEFDGIETRLPEMMLIELRWTVTVEVMDFATGQTVVYNEIVSVVKEPILAGQSVTVAAQPVIVYTVVL
jgi:hypothetical protein